MYNRNVNANAVDGWICTISHFHKLTKVDPIAMTYDSESEDSA